MATIKLKSTIGKNTIDFNGTVESYMKNQKIICRIVIVKTVKKKSVLVVY